MAKEEIEKAKRSLSKISKEHEKLHEIALQMTKKEEKEKTDKSLESEITKQRKIKEVEEVKKELKAPENIGLRTAGARLEETIAIIPFSGDEEKNEDPYSTKKGYASSTPSGQNKPKQAYESVGIEQSITDIKTARLEMEEQKETKFMKRPVAGPVRDGSLPIVPLTPDISRYVENKILDHEKLDREKKVRPAKFYDMGVQQ